eukprot:UN08379
MELVKTNTDNIWFCRKQKRSIYLVLHFTRYWQYYVWRVLLILNIISIMTFAVFGFDEETLHDQFAYLATLLLSTVAYLYIIAEKVPSLKYLTLIDKYLYAVRFLYR